MESDIDAAARFEVNQFMFERAGSIIGLSLTDHQKHTLFHRFKKVLEDAEYKINRARTPPPGHIIDDAGVVRKVLGVLPVTADGCVAAPGGVIWPQLLIDNDEGGRVAWSLYDICTGDTCDDGEWLADKCWSTLEAAEAAKEATK